MIKRQFIQFFLAFYSFGGTGYAADFRVGDAVPIWNIPGKHEGKIVLIDFWATWCGPCKAEIPHVRRAYETYKNAGLDIVGIPLDNNTEDVTQFISRNKMPWKQYYYEGGFDNELAKAFVVKAIPACFLIDGDTQKILATTNQLRGPGLSNFIGRELIKKKGQSK